MDKNKLTSLMKRAAPFITGLAGDVNEETVDKDIEAVLMALETHKDSADHDDDAHVWTALNKFMQVMEVSGIMPIVGDSADIGSPTHLFRKGFFSELSTLIFKKENVLVMDGTFVLCKQSGKFVADVAASDTQIDFGQALTVGDILILRAENKMEYMRVGTKVSGTDSTYNVTRNLDGSGADAWPAESVYFVRGKAGDGWLELTASGEQRMSVFTQGAAWNQNTEVVRIGTLDGWQNAGLTGLGLVIGNYATKEYMVYDTATKKMFVSGEVNAANNAARLYQFGIDLRGEGSACTFYGTGTGTVPLGRLQLLFDPHYPDNTWVSLKHNKRVEIIGGNLGNISKITVTENDGVAIKGNTDIQGTIGSSDIVTVPGADKIPRADADGKLALGWLPDIPAPQWQDLTPTLDGWSGTPTYQFRYLIEGKKVSFVVFVNGTSNSVNARIYLPPELKSATVSLLSWSGPIEYRLNNVPQSNPGKWRIPGNSQTIYLTTDFASGDWPSTGGKFVSFQGFYEIG